MGKRVIQFLLSILVATLICASANATNYWLSPRGANTNAGTDSSSTGAWRTLGYADAQLAAGDTLFVLGGTYISLADSATVAASRNASEFNNTGYINNRIVVKAYGDSKAHFWGTGIPAYPRQFVTIASTANNIVFDGFSYTTPTDSLYLVWDCIATPWVTGWGPPDSCAITTLRPGINRVFSVSGDSCKITGIEINNNHPPGVAIRNWMANNLTCNKGTTALTTGGPAHYGVYSDGSALRDTLSSCYIHHILFPCGNIGDGDFSCPGTCDVPPASYPQGTGEALFLNPGAQFWYVNRNTFYDAAHAIMSIEQATAKFNKIVGNKLTNYWGGGIYVIDNARENLIDQNVVLHSGESTTKTKSGLAIEGSRNTVRRNIVYCPSIGGATVSSYAACQQHAIFDIYAESCRADSNFIYNNTFFDGPRASIVFRPSGTGATVSHNSVFNNIFYKSYGRTINANPQVPAVIDMYMYDADASGNWLSDDSYGGALHPESTNFGYNKIHNNVIYKNQTTYVGTDSLLRYVEDGTYGGGASVAYSVAHHEALDAVAWKSNLLIDPGLSSETPDSDTDNTWWHIGSTSGCVNTGRYVPDNVGSSIEALHPGYGWDTLSISGTARDIGAYEYPSVTTTGCTVSPTAISFGTYPIGDSTGVDSFEVDNTSTGWISGTIILSNYTNFSITSNGGAYLIPPGDSIWVKIQFNPQAGGLLSCTAEVGESECDDVTITGMACSVTPSTVDFGDIKAGECSANDTITITNTGTGTITGTVSMDTTDYSFVSGSGAFSLGASESKAIILKFCPDTKGIKPINIHLGEYFDISNVSFLTGSTSITVYFTTSQTAYCRVDVGDYLESGDILFSTAYNGSTIHGTSHQHTISGLESGDTYAIRLYARNAYGEYVYSPSSTGYYIVQAGVSGLFKGTNPVPSTN